MDTFYNWLGFVIVAALAWVVASVALQRHPEWARRTHQIILLGVFLRIVGAYARYEIFFQFYDGGGDATGYYVAGVEYAQGLRNLDFGILLDRSLWWAGRWWGTQFVRFVSGFVVALIGPSMRGEFLVFSLLAFIGLVLCGRAFHRTFPWVPRWRYLAWVLLWPSLWYWPSSVGKESFILLCVGLATAGHIGSGRSPNWLLFAAGVGLAFCVRPHVAAVLIGAALASNWLTTRQLRTPADVARLIVVAVLSLAIGLAALDRFGVEQVDLEGVQEFMEHRAGLTAKGGSAIATSGGLVNIPMAFVNILVRPFPWEAHHVLALVSSLEMIAFWFLVWRRRAVLRQALVGWRKNRLLTFSLVYAVGYVLMIGLVFQNLGIIARQRVLVFPFLFVLLEAAPDVDHRSVQPSDARHLLPRFGHRRVST